MRKRVLLAAAAAVATVVAAMVLRTAPLHEPQYLGKPLSFWLEGYYPYNTQGRKEADRAVLNIGTNAIPILLRYLQGTDSTAVTNWVYDDPRRQTQRTTYENNLLLAYPIIGDLVRRRVLFARR